MDKKTGKKNAAACFLSEMSYSYMGHVLFKSPSSPSVYCCILESQPRGSLCIFVVDNESIIIMVSVELSTKAAVITAPSIHCTSH